MGFKLNSLCEETNLTKSTKTVFSKLCDHTSLKPNGLYQCFLSIKTVARKTGLSTRTVERAVKFLRQNSYISIEKMRWKQGGYPYNLYTINVEKLGLKDQTD